MEAAGYQCVRSAASKGCWDVVAFSATDTVVIQCKTNAWPGALEVEAMELYPLPPNTRRLIHRWDDGARLPLVREIA